jgi:hypothetical protein
MKYLIAGLLIGGFAGQLFGYAVAGQNPLRVEVPVVGECQLPPQVARMQELVDRMPLAITVTETGAMPQEASRGAETVREPSDYPRWSFAAVAPIQRDEIALLIEEVR